jgi:hypothetical protein
MPSQAIKSVSFFTQGVADITGSWRGLPTMVGLAYVHGMVDGKAINSYKVHSSSGILLFDRLYHLEF